MALAACGGKHDDPRLAKAEALMWSNPDSALATAQAVDTASLDEADRAYRQLLLAQARYRCYKTTLADTLLAADAERYYSTRRWQRDSVLRERYTRALLYHGAIYEDRDSVFTALQYYYRGLETAAESDCRNRAQLHLRLATVYCDNLSETQIHVEHYLAALRYYKQLGDRQKQAVCYASLGANLRVSDRPAALAYLDSAIVTARTAGDSVNYAFAMESKARAHLMDSLPRLAKDQCLECLARGVGGEQCLHTLVEAYLLLGMEDSARMYASRIDLDSPAPNRSLQVLRYKTQARLARCAGYMELYQRLTHLKDRYVDSVECNPHLDSINNVERQYAISLADHYRKKSQHLETGMHWILYLAAILLTAWFAILWWHKKWSDRQWRELVNRLNMQQTADGHEELLRSLEGEHQALHDALAMVIEHMKEYSDVKPTMRRSDELPSRIQQQVKEDRKRIEELEPALRKVVFFYCDDEDYVSDAKMEQLPVKSRLMLELRKLGFSFPEIAVCLDYTSPSSVRSRYHKLMSKPD